MSAAGEATVTVNATPAETYALVSDVTRTAEWSPECVRVEWLEEGKRFRGHNKDGSREWSMDCVVDVADPKGSFAFHTERDGVARTRWGYRIEGPPSGPTQLTEWYERVAKISPIVRLVERFAMGGRQQHNDANVAASLQRIKEILER